jgi:hypothetical protein
MSSTPTTRPKPFFQLTPEQLALQANRRELKAKKEAERKAAVEANGGITWPEGSEILVRPWIDIPRPLGEGDVMRGNAVKVMTWNVRDRTKVYRRITDKLWSRRCSLNLLFVRQPSPGLFCYI